MTSTKQNKDLNSTANNTQVTIGNMVTGRWFDGKRAPATGVCIKILKDKYHLQLTETFSKKYQIGIMIVLYQQNCWNLSAGETSPDDWEKVGRWRAKPTGAGRVCRRGSKGTKYEKPVELMPSLEIENHMTNCGIMKCIKWAFANGYITQEIAEQRYKTDIYEPALAEYNILVAGELKKRAKLKKVNDDEKAHMEAELIKYRAMKAEEQLNLLEALNEKIQEEEEEENPETPTKPIKIKKKKGKIKKKNVGKKTTTE